MKIRTRRRTDTDKEEINLYDYEVGASISKNVVDKKWKIRSRTDKKEKIPTARGSSRRRYNQEREVDEDKKWLFQFHESGRY